MMVVVVVMMMMATALVVLAVFVAEAEGEEVVVGLSQVSFGKKESGPGNDVAVMSSVCRQISQELTVAALQGRRI